MVIDMREMKDSKIDYIGVIPDDWHVKRLKYVLKERNYRSKTGEEMLLSVSQYRGVVPSDTIQRTMQANSLIGYKKVYLSDLVFNKLNPVLARFGVSTYEGITSPDFAIYYTTEADSRFLCYLLKTSSYITEYGRICTGVGDGFSRLYTPMLYNISVALPSQKQQMIIAEFLDAKCAEIDALSADIQSEIDTLEAYKQSVIAGAVTKGVEKDVPLKDSGMAWCKRIPVHWEVIPSKYLFANSDLRRLYGDEQLTASQRHGIITQTEYMERENAKIVFANQGLENWKHVSPNDYIISLRSFQGGLELSEVSGCITWHYVVLKAKKPIFHRYYKWLFKSSMYITALQRTCNFIRDGQDLRYSNFTQVPLPLPPIAEQKKIADYLDGKCRDIDDIIALKREQLAVLADYKKSVIYEYVTGKKEVPVI